VNATWRSRSVESIVYHSVVWIETRLPAKAASELVFYVDVRHGRQGLTGVVDGLSTVRLHSH
jgi:hypothetical protein